MDINVTAEIPLTSANLPRHVAIIMDGNNRWAKQRNQLGITGHKAGVEAVRKVVTTCAQEGVEVLTLFAFSSENWRRPEDEVSALMRLFLFALEREVKKIHRNNIRLKIIGDRLQFSELLQKHMFKAEALTAENTGMTLVIAANYGGQWDIVQASQKIAEQVEKGVISSKDVNNELFQSFLSIGDLPAPDLMIRTAGELRISNFMLWQLAYAEFYFSDLYWPDFGSEQMILALSAYQHRKRRFGQTDDQLQQISSSNHA
ncbi:MAG: undecaprenyl diphosphate synthase [Oleiphilaceae bacterium]|jgi:undecaprenyl diphosphate synthase